MGYSKQAFKGISWLGALRVLIRSLSFIKIAILARLLLPAQFGLFGIAGLILAFLETVTETGVNVVLIQQTDDAKDYLNTAWIVSIARGILISALIFFSIPFITHFFKSSDAQPILKLMSLVPLIRGFINPAIIFFQKQLAFHKEFYFRSSLIFVETLFTVLLTLITRSASSLVYGLIISALLEVILSFVFVKPRPKLAFELLRLKKVLNRGKWVTAASVFNYLFQQGDDILVGRILNTSALGFYQMAYKISTLPITEVADTISKITFPVYAKIALDKPRIKQAYLKVTAIISLLVIPFGLGLFFFTQPIVNLVLGPNWLVIVPVLKILTVFGVIRAITGSASALFLALNKQEYVTALTLSSILGLALSLYPLIVKFGILGAGLAALIGSLTAIPVIGFCLIKALKHEKD
ncbi:MAG: lipopolysaccharide biosynthesis protein [Candidatus Beckwithbacteria bacterium]